MRLKEIKPGMAIHCKNDEEKKASKKNRIRSDEDGKCS